MSVPEGGSEPDGMDQQSKVAPELHAPSKYPVRLYPLRASRSDPIACFQDYQAALVFLCDVMEE
eukprot:9916548-Ditylum_brightwellii.AAC.1